MNFLWLQDFRPKTFEINSSHHYFDKLFYHFHLKKATYYYKKYIITTSSNSVFPQMFSCTCGSPDTALSIMDVGTMSIELRHDMGSNRTLRTGSLMDSTQV